MFTTSRDLDHVLSTLDRSEDRFNSFDDESAPADYLDAVALWDMLTDLEHNAGLPEQNGRIAPNQKAAMVAAAVIDYLPEDKKPQYKEALRVQMVREMVETFRTTGSATNGFSDPSSVYAVVDTNPLKATVPQPPTERVNKKNKEHLRGHAAYEIFLYAYQQREAAGRISGIEGVLLKEFKAWHKLRGEIE